jgi:predicted DsbA family dithiol-disulfide isomerase
VSEDRPDRTFTDYHRVHRHAAGAQDADVPRFQIPAMGDRYPRSSLPALEAATWAREEHPGVFEAFDLALFEAFFGRTEDISDTRVLGRIGASVGLDASALSEALGTGRYRPRVYAEYLEAANQGIHGIPTILIPGQVPIVGAVPYGDLTRAVERAFAGTSPGTLDGPRKNAESGASIIQEGTACF